MGPFILRRYYYSLRFHIFYIALWTSEFSHYRENWDEPGGSTWILNGRPKNWNLRSSERRIDPSVANELSSEQLFLEHNSPGQYVGRPFSNSVSQSLVHPAVFRDVSLTRITYGTWLVSMKSFWANRAWYKFWSTAVPITTQRLRIRVWCKSPKKAEDQLCLARW